MSKSYRYRLSTCSGTFTRGAYALEIGNLETGNLETGNNNAYQLKKLALFSILRWRKRLSVAYPTLPAPQG